MMADSGTSLNMIPDVDFFAIKDLFFSDKHCYTLKNSLTACDCTKEEHEAIPEIKFDINGDEYIFNRDMWYERKDNTCVIKFMHAPGRSEWILGVNFFQNYYAVMDYSEQRIGFAKSKNWGKAGSRHFIEWALSGSSLLNLVATYVKSPVTSLSSEILLATSLLAMSFFASYYMIIKKN